MGVGVSAKGKGQLQEVQGCFPRFEQLQSAHSRHWLERLAFVDISQSTHRRHCLLLLSEKF